MDTTPQDIFVNYLSDKGIYNQQEKPLKCKPPLLRRRYLQTKDVCRLQETVF